MNFPTLFVLVIALVALVIALVANAAWSDALTWRAEEPEEEAFRQAIRRPKPRPGPGRVIHDLTLFEISVVPYPANPHAVILGTRRSPSP